MLILVTPNAIGDYPTVPDLLPDGWLAAVPLAVDQFDTGIGTRRP